ncbi:LacI family DNA-binding transcriptional regulator [Microbacterium sp. Root53]|uniref:LacI family DNA-binding transcriptional regulator n=1 Tax=Microbacterium sp. Root53 TaxID=1736553 RepID=UPI0019100183|nr:LacI family DNA-binding transcriptional regulator [Microbacterium sp. Root53]
MPEPRPTMKDVADHLGVSRQLVSLVLRDLPGASEETRRRVRAAAEELGYHPDDSARVLRGHRSRRLGVLFTMREPFEVDLVEELFAGAAERGYALVLGPLSAARSQRTVLAELLGQRIEGLLVLAAEGGSATIDDLPGIPLVQLGGPRALETADDVRVDDTAGIDLLVEHLAGLGHRAITHVSGGDGPNARERRLAYEAAMERRGLALDVVPAAFTEDAGARAAQDLLARKRLPSAILAANDRCAAGVLGTLVRAGVRVPADVSVAGFDDSSIARLPYTQMTTVRHDPARLAGAALDAIVRRIDDPDATTVRHLEPPLLIVRASTGPALAR